jgi:hypothetical protein
MFTVAGWSGGDVFHPERCPRGHLFMAMRILYLILQ